MRKKGYIKWGILLAVECLILAGCFLAYKRTAGKIVLESSAYLTEEGIFLEDFLDTGLDGVYIDSSMGEKSEFIKTQAIDLPFGFYEITIHYAAGGGPHQYTINKEDADFRFWKGNSKENLPAGKNCYTAYVWGVPELKGLSISFDFKGDGYLLVGQVEITQQKTWLLGCLFFLLILFGLLDIAVLKKDRIYEYFADAAHRMQWFGCAFIILFASVPLFAPAIFKGHDLEFHLMRIEGLREGLRGGQFPVKIQPNWMNGYGYGASLFYGDVFLYLPALLRLCGVSVQGAYKIFVFLVNVSACLSGFYVFRRFSKDDRIGLLGSFLYTCSIYRLTCVYIRAAVGEYLALTFLPLFFWGIYEILFENAAEKCLGKEPEGCRIEGWLLAALSYTGIVYSHVISAEIAAVFTVLAGLVFWRHTFRKDRMWRIVKCGAVMAACSLAFLVPFLDMARDPYQFNAGQNEGKIQSGGAALNQLFSLFPNGVGNALSYSTLERTMGNGNEMPYALGGGFIAAAALFLAYYVCGKEKEDSNTRKSAGFLLFAVLTTFMTTSLFPWNFLQRSSGLLNYMIQNIQFPWRLLGISTLVFTFFVCAAVEVFRTWQKYGVVALTVVVMWAVISSGYLLSGRMTDNSVWCVKNADSLNDFNYMGGEYLPENCEYADKSITNPVLSDGVRMIQCDRSSNHFRICCLNESGQTGYIDAPLLYYRGYEAIDTETGMKLQVVKSKEAKVRILLPAGFDGEISLYYHEYWYWRIAELISLCTIVLIVVINAGYQRKQRKTGRLPLISEK